MLGKAGAKRALGRRPKVRGAAMNIVDHPHGGGRGKGKGDKPAISWSGKLTQGVRTRKPKSKKGNKMCVASSSNLAVDQADISPGSSKNARGSVSTRASCTSRCHIAYVRRAGPCINFAWGSACKDTNTMRC